MTHEGLAITAAALCLVAATLAWFFYAPMPRPAAHPSQGKTVRDDGILDAAWDMLDRPREPRAQV